MNPFENQFQRMMRYYRRVERTEHGIRLTPEYTGDHAADDVYGFFLNCYHLKDWLIHDPAFSKKTKQEIEDYAKNTPCLAICADICNASKHLKLEKRLKSGELPKMEDRDLSFHEGGKDSGLVTIKLHVEHKQSGQTALKLTGGERIQTAWELATDCIKAWT